MTPLPSAGLPRGTLPTCAPSLALLSRRVLARTWAETPDTACQCVEVGRPPDPVQSPRGFTAARGRGLVAWTIRPDGTPRCPRSRWHRSSSPRDTPRWPSRSLALRRMVPWAGSAVSVTAVLLAVYLAALAGGYRRGGLLARRGDPRPRLAVRLSGAGALAAFWLSDLGTLAAFGLPVPPLAQVTAYSIVGIAPVGWLLAESVLLAHACAPAHEPSEKAGGIFAVSTVGNVLGALLTTFVLLRFLGTAAAAIVLVAAGCSSLPAMASRRSIPVRRRGRAGGLPGAGPVDRGDPVRGAERLRGLPDRRARRRRTHARGLRAGRLAPRRARAGLGLRGADRADPVRGGRDARAGPRGGRDDARQGGFGAQWTSLSWTSIRPKNGSVRGSLGVPTGDAGRFAAADARAFLRGDSGDWEAIFVDTYSNSRTLPQHLLTAEFYRLARSRLAVGGSLYVNHLTWPHDALFRTRAERTLRTVFADCSAWPVGIEQGRGWHEALSAAGNLLFRCRKSGLDGDQAIYSDALPRSDLDRSLR